MSVQYNSIEEVVHAIDLDRHLTTRYPSRIIFLNSIHDYFHLCRALEDWADETIFFSDERFTNGADTLPNMQAVTTYIARNPGKTYLIPAIGEYLRFAEKTESMTQTLHGLINRESLSDKRVWIPIFGAQDIFNRVIGELDDERFGDYVFNIIGLGDEFSITVYSKSFQWTNSLNFSAIGLRKWFELWERLNISNGASLCTSKHALIAETIGQYSVHIIKSPFEYIKQNINDTQKLKENQGDVEQWGTLAGYVPSAKGSIIKLFTHALNCEHIDTNQILSQWKSLDKNENFGRWVYWMWHQLALDNKPGYISFAVRESVDYSHIIEQIQVSILSEKISNTVFDDWLIEREKALKALALDTLCPTFWKKFIEVIDDRLKLKILTTQTLRERKEIIKVVGKLLREGTHITDLSYILRQKYPILDYYLNANECIPSARLKDYISTYKKYKIMDIYDEIISNMALQCDLLSFNTRTSKLNEIKHKTNAYYLWIDGLGIEWLDLLLLLIRRSYPEIQVDLSVCSSLLPTITSRNIENVSSEIFSKKYDRLDALSHIKDKIDSEYQAIIEDQFSIMSDIATMVTNYLDDNPDMDLVITADHGMSRMAALAFHKLTGITAPPGSEVNSHGRYCELKDSYWEAKIKNIFQDGNYLVFADHNHFTISGHAPGEIHGGMSPEEYLVPVLHLYRPKPTTHSINNQEHSTPGYEIKDKTIKLDEFGSAQVYVQAHPSALQVMGEIENMQVSAEKVSDIEWCVSFEGLIPGRKYKLKIFIDGIYNPFVEEIEILRRGIIVDDDF